MTRRIALIVFAAMTVAAPAAAQKINVKAATPNQGAQATVGLDVVIDGSGFVVPGPVFPFVCITIACGAVSGFHALISSGTTPKLLAREKDIRLIGYGAMVTEMLVALMAIIAAAALPPRLEAMANRIAALSDAVTRRYFALLPAAQAVGKVPVDVHALATMSPDQLRALALVHAAPGEVDSTADLPAEDADP